MVELVRSTNQLDSGERLGARHPADLLVMLLLSVGFFLGPIKLLGASWLGYLTADGLALLVLFVVFAERVASRKPLFVASPLSVPLILLAALCVLEVANPEAPFIRSLMGLRSWVLYLGFYFVGLYAVRSVKQLERLYAVLLTLGLLTAVYGVYQWNAGPQSFASWSDEYGRYARFTWSAGSGVVFRAFSTFVLPNTFGANMALLMLLAFSVATCPSTRALWRGVAAATFVVMGAGIGVSGSRGPVAQLLLAATVGVAFIPGVRGRARAGFLAVVMIAVATVGVGFVVGPVIGERFSTLFDPQTFFWKWFGPLTNGIQIAQEHPFGLGLGYTAGVPQFISDPTIRELPTANIDSGYGSAAAELGFIGLALFMYFAVKVGVESFRAWKSLPNSRLRYLLLGPALLGATYPILSVVAQPQATLPSSIYSWLLIGILMKTRTPQRALDADQLFRAQVHSGQ